MDMTNKDFCDKIREITSELSKSKFDKQGIFSDPPIFPKFYVGLDTYNEILKDKNHIINKLINKNK